MRKKSHITGIVYPIDHPEVYNKSLGTVMLDIIEKQLGEKLFPIAMEKLKKQIEEQA